MIDVEVRYPMTVIGACVLSSDILHIATKLWDTLPPRTSPNNTNIVIRVTPRSLRVLYCQDQPESDYPIASLFGMPIEIDRTLPDETPFQLDFVDAPA